MKAPIPILLICFSVIGIVVSGYALHLHHNPQGDSFCNLNSRFNCDAVNTGEYSELAGIPVAVLGIVGYAAVALGSMLALHYRKLWEYVMMASGLGLAFALYLTAIEVFVLHTYCLVCLASQVIILAIFILSVIQFRYVRYNISRGGAVGEGIPRT